MSAAVICISTLLPGLFAANIAAITLTGQFFKQVDSYAEKVLKGSAYTLNWDNKSDYTFENGFFTGKMKDGRDSVNKNVYDIEIWSIRRTLLLTFIFIVSELLLIISYTLYKSPCLSCISMSIFVVGIILMFGLLATEYFFMVNRKIDTIQSKEIKLREENSITLNP